jgi:hypothetical protein
MALWHPIYERFLVENRQIIIRFDMPGSPSAWAEKKENRALGNPGP